ncbi:hypothetical protein K488DRAFT_41045 [Vararia minispora EC-137]|uniref:Uncharacterized protein n=1 Tax=Vararia minispora EC-137 TaxID=1314806 RepID=A0ACB8QXE0_9AGAM|nr:hypothetical protein K488DRAFT_41045 [Vararia minispora EC-137]
MPSSEHEFQEASSIVFEWRLRDLHSLFEASKGETKSKVTKSVLFGNGRWQVLLTWRLTPVRVRSSQVLFYANAGTGSALDSTSGHISLFLSCEVSATGILIILCVHSRWIREGVWKFTFEIYDLAKSQQFNMKEAQNHTFSYKTANWGWAQFSRRDTVYYSRNAVKNADAFLITCTISGRPAPPAPPSAIPRLLVPKDLLDAVGGLLDDPNYSDVEFVLPRRGSGLRNAKRIYAMRNVLKRAEYFGFMFNGGFAEASTNPFMVQDDPSASEIASEMGDLGTRAEDSDEEDECLSDAESVNDARERIDLADSQIDLPPPTSTDDLAHPLDSPDNVADEQDERHSRNVRAKLSHPSSPRSSHVPVIFENRDDSRKGPRKMCVIVKDVAYSTYRAVLYYLYTDTIHFAPLSSSFYAAVARPQSAMQPLVSDGHTGTNSRAGQATGDVYVGQQPNVGSRREFIDLWAQANPGRPVPCSAKAVYRLADKLGLRELKERAFEHIIKSLTVENVPYEVFSTFSATFEAVRKVEVKFFLDHWMDIRSSDAMRNVWQQIRLGRHPGFEEVWPVIATNLEFNPQTAAVPVEGQST